VVKESHTRDITGGINRMNKDLKEGEHFYWIERDGYRYKVWTEKYLLERGFCCNNSCKHCPYKNKKSN